jgi:Flp pilus assembly protein TadG
MSGIRKWLGKLDGRSGQTLIEFAFIAPIIFIFLFAIVDFGLALDRRITLQHAVREGSRTAAVAADPTAAIDTTVAEAQGLIDSSNVDVCFTDENGDGRAEYKERVKVAVTYDYHFTIPFVGLLDAFGIAHDATITMTPDGTSALENDPDASVTFTECP